MIHVIIKHIGSVGRMLSGSKSGYSQTHPGNLTVFNANLIVDGRKVWYGDIDLTLQEKELQAAATEIGKPIYVLREMDARFDNEKKPLLDKAVKVVKP